MGYQPILLSARSIILANHMQDREEKRKRLVSRRSPHLGDIKASPECVPRDRATTHGTQYGVVAAYDPVYGVLRDRIKGQVCGFAADGPVVAFESLGYAAKLARVHMKQWVSRAERMLGGAGARGW
jgi:hypothetical protein